ncbi:hypothetical protein CEUSTIGMA_g11326.t1 [Chlamydomonas eustigma]|uniref:Uncharacterized protein n=1 Tax=Chlamydomonas eustigma TaxID=1157962 RepID=A0A250XLY0_9CHLO|nr:hypothetical protein CEUSTIGMA_g11326.t1 [Chlamydomonas eustigma]|eukprot:GAX83902.1 hypothetical protein CEUSTIGMA_g11326.t1 [Chlamydomonas eustigma]
MNFKSIFIFILNSLPSLLHINMPEHADPPSCEIRRHRRELLLGTGRYALPTSYQPAKPGSSCTTACGLMDKTRTQNDHQSPDSVRGLNKNTSTSLGQITHNCRHKSEQTSQQHIKKQQHVTHASNLNPIACRQTASTHKQYSLNRRFKRTRLLWQVSWHCWCSPQHQQQQHHIQNIGFSSEQPDDSPTHGPGHKQISKHTSTLSILQGVTRHILAYVGLPPLPDLPLPPQIPPPQQLQQLANAINSGGLQVHIDLGSKGGQYTVDIPAGSMPNNLPSSAPFSQHQLADQLSQQQRQHNLRQPTAASAPITAIKLKDFLPQPAPTSSSRLNNAGPDSHG